MRYGAGGGGDCRRLELPPIALNRAARRRGGPNAPAEALVIGDSVHDVACARDHGIPVLAVASGWTAAADLAAAGADWVVPDLAAAVALLPCVVPIPPPPPTCRPDRLTTDVV